MNMKWLHGGPLAFMARALKRAPTSGKFVILCQARTGSNLLADLLNQFDDIRCLGEIFKRRSVGLPGDLRCRMGMTWRERDLYPLTYMNRLFGLLDEPIVGFRMFPRHNRFMLSYVSEAVEIKKVVLQRNPVDSFISFKHAISTNQWRKRRSDRSDRKENTGETIKFDESEFERYVSVGEKYFDLIRRCEKHTGQQFHWLDYDLLKEIEPVRDVARFLGSSGNAPTLKPRIVKQITRPKNETISNYEEMISYLELRYPKLVPAREADKDEKIGPKFKVA